LPDDLLELIQSYLDKHTPVEENESFKLHDELWSLFQKDVRDQPTRYAIFLAILRLLNPALRRSNKILQWWDVLFVPVLGHIREQKGLAVEAHNFLLDVLVYDDDDENIEGTDAAQTSMEVSEQLLDTYIKQATLANTESDTAASYMERQIKKVLMAFGYKRQRVSALLIGIGVHLQGTDLTLHV
jgi:solute carrier family 25 protein 16